MKEDYSKIIEKAKELSVLIKEHEITQSYDKSIEEMKKDIRAQELLAKLVMIGRDLDQMAQEGGDMQTEQSAENQMLREELENNKMVKQHIMAQKQYLSMIQIMQERIKNPVVEE